MSEPKKYILDQFQTHLKSSFETYCIRHNLKNSQEQFISYLIDHQLITPINLQKFTILREYEDLRARYTDETKKTEFVNILASRFCLSERTVWGILKAVKTTTPTKKKK